MKKFQSKSLAILFGILSILVLIRSQVKQRSRKLWLHKIELLAPSQNLTLTTLSDPVNDQNGKTLSIQSPEKKKWTRKTESSFREPKTKNQKPTVKVNINTANDSLLMALRGIGPVLSQRIIKFRNRLGGFVQVDQLKEVYGLKEETYDEFKKYLLCSGAVTQLDPVIDEFKVLLRHPYLEYEDVKSIKQFIRRRGIDNSLNLKTATGKSDLWVARIRPYIKIKSTDGAVVFSVKLN